MQKITVDRLQEILLNHKRWAEARMGGQRAHLGGAHLGGADLQGANLGGADLRDADLQGANLRGADGEKIEITKAPLCIDGLRWPVTIWDAHMQIGCEFHSHNKWASYDDARIEAMDRAAMEFWADWKSTLLALCAKHAPAQAFNPLDHEQAK